jgi:tetratricopeptide (TPR) repeat protein
VVAALALPGLLLAWVRFPLSRWVAAAILLHMISLLSVFVTERYRLVAVPGLLLFAAFGLWQLWQACALAHFREVGVYVGLLTLSTWFVSIPKHDASLWALDSYNSGLQALESGQLSLAEHKLDFAYSYVPGNAELNFALGNLRLAQGNQVEAKSYYHAALRLDPRHEGSYNNLGILALEANQPRLAASFFTKAVEQDDRDAKTWYLLAKAHRESGELTKAGIEIARAIQLDPRPPEFFLLRDDIAKADTLQGPTPGTSQPE